VVGELRLIGGEDPEPLASDRVPGAAAPGPGGQHVVEAPIGIHRGRGQRIPARPGVARCPVPGDRPADVPVLAAPRCRPTDSPASPRTAERGRGHRSRERTARDRPRTRRRPAGYGTHARRPASARLCPSRKPSLPCDGHQRTRCAGIRAGRQLSKFLMPMLARWRLAPDRSGAGPGAGASQVDRAASGRGRNAVAGHRVASRRGRSRRAARAGPAT
jgi:hypothetical protein